MTQEELEKIFKKEFEKDEFQECISKIKYNESASKSELAVFIVPNIYLANWVKNKYGEKLRIIFEKYFNTRPEIRLVPELQKKNVKSLKQITQKTETLLNSSYTFETFICGESNKVAYEIAKRISEKQGTLYNPVLFYGGTGLGKTHLLNAIGNKVAEKNKTVIYVTAEQFLNDFVSRITNNTMEKFREKYRNCDYLLIDDVQFFSGKQQIQEEFFHTFNDLHSQNKQIVMTADKSPRQIIGLEDRLKSRFEWSTNFEIYPPGLETKIEIIKQKCLINKIHLDKEIIEFLASNVGTDIRQIEGTIIRLNAQAAIIRQDITLETAKQALKDHQKETYENITIDKIIQMVAKYFNIKPSEIKSKSRVSNIAKARRITIYLCRQLIPNSMKILAQELNMKDHSAVSKAISTINKEMQADSMLKLRIDEIKKQL